MRIVDQSTPIDGHVEHACHLVKPGTAPVDDAYGLQAEHVVRVYVNGELTMNLTCSPDHIVELVVGRLFTEGMVAGIGDIDEVWLCEHSTRVMVFLRDR
ncbi:MAG: formate dehydrogenase accessory sulfurtransferase FdhD, partial [Coriobacteriaceae bacterium]|nr:formate dehydrogenase accessory sulfurtransferase FdhD [Coriobacteriaceae bacterium]